VRVSVRSCSRCCGQVFIGRYSTEVEATKACADAQEVRDALSPIHNSACYMLHTVGSFMHIYMDFAEPVKRATKCVYHTQTHTSTLLKSLHMQELMRIGTSFLSNVTGGCVKGSSLLRRRTAAAPTSTTAASVAAAAVAAAVQVAATLPFPQAHTYSHAGSTHDAHASLPLAEMHAHSALAHAPRQSQAAIVDVSADEGNAPTNTGQSSDGFTAIYPPTHSHQHPQHFSGMQNTK
jgi:hypothetical protein